jgi:hypothetical protein
MQTKPMPTVRKQYDVFARKGKAGWVYQFSIDANSPEQAKAEALRENPTLRKHLTAVYPRK